MSTWAGRGVCWPIRSPTCWGRSPGTPHSFTSLEPNSAMLRERRRMFHTVFRFLNFGLQLGIIQGFSLHFLLLNVLVILALKTITEKRLKKFNFRFWRSYLFYSSKSQVFTTGYLQIQSQTWRIYFFQI